METTDPGAFGKALWIARSYRGLALWELAAEAGMSRQTVSAIENGTAALFRLAARALADALRFPYEFFFSPPPVPDRRVFHFRCNANVPEYALARARAHAALFDSITSSFGAFATFARKRLPTAQPTDDDAIECAAEAFRGAVGLRVDTPIVNAVRAVEAAGVFFGVFDPGAMRIDGFACSMRVPIIVVNAGSTWSRRRFSTMHELGHLILHKDSLPDEREEQANRFAGAVLIPRAAFWREFPRPIKRQFDWAALIAMKERWGVSIQAIIHRAHDLGLIDAVQYRTANIHISKYGWKTSEPGELDPEQPEVCSVFISELRRRSAVPSLCTSAKMYAEDVHAVLGVQMEQEVEESRIIRLGAKRPSR